MFMSGAGFQKPIAPSMWYCSPVAGSLRGSGVNWADAVDAVNSSAVTNPYTQRADFCNLLGMGSCFSGQKARLRSHYNVVVTCRLFFSARRTEKSAISSVTVAVELSAALG